MTQGIRRSVSVATLAREEGFPEDLVLKTLQEAGLDAPDRWTLVDRVQARDILSPLRVTHHRSEETERPEPLGQGAGNGALVGDQAQYGAKINHAVRKGVESIDEVGDRYANNTPPTRTGYVAEADHAATFNNAAAFQRSSLRAERLDSNLLKSADIQITEKGETARLVSSKVYKTADDSAMAQRGYGSQDRLVPKDQLADVQKVAGRKAVSEAAKGRPNRDAVAREWQEVNEFSTDRIRHRDVESTPRTRAESTEISNKAKTGEVTGQEVVGDLGARAVQGAKSGAKAGATASAAISTVVEGYAAFKDVRDGRKTIGEAALDAGIEVTKSTADGTFKGTVAGGTNAAAKVLAERATSSVAKTVLKSNAPAAIAITGVEIARSAVSLARGKIDVEQFKQSAAASAVNGTASYVGAAIGGSIGGPPGAIIGGIAGPLVVSMCDNAGLLTRLDRVFSWNTATGHDDSILFHQAQRAEVCGRLFSAGISVFLDRVLPHPTGGHRYAAFVIPTRKRVYAVDFRAWKGDLRFEPKTATRTVKSSFLFIPYESSVTYETGEVDKSTILKTSNFGHLKRLSNPLKPLKTFSFALKDWVAAQTPRRPRLWVEPVIVFENGAVSFDAQMEENGAFLDFDAFLARLSEEDPTNVSPWVLDALSMVPTWDVLTDASGTIYQGLILNESLEMKMLDGTVKVPFTSILKAEISPGSTFSRADKVKITLRNQSSLEGEIEKCNIVLQKGKFRRSFHLWDLQMLCPAFSFFT